MIKKVSIIILAITCISLVVLLIIQRNKYTETVDKYTEAVDKLLNKDKNINNSINDITRVFSIQVNSIGNKILPDLILTDINHVQYNISQVFDENYKLCFRFYENSCSACIDRQLLDLEILSNKIGNGKIVVICDYNEDKFKWLVYKYNSKFKCYRSMSNSSLGLNIEKEHIPYYFISNNNFKPLFIFPITDNTNNFVQSFYEGAMNVIIEHKK